MIYDRRVKNEEKRIYINRTFSGNSRTCNNNSNSSTKILDVIEKSRRSAWGESAGLMAKAAELKYSEGNLTNTERDEITYI